MGNNYLNFRDLKIEMEKRKDDFIHEQYCAFYILQYIIEIPKFETN